jgi:hypothetical protein
VNPSGVVIEVIVDDVTVAIAGAAAKRAAHAAKPAHTAPSLKDLILDFLPEDWC